MKTNTVEVLYYIQIVAKLYTLLYITYGLYIHVCQVFPQHSARYR